MKATTKKVRIGVKCGDCIHFKQSPKFEDVCSELGVSSKMSAPDCYGPDFYRLNSVKNPETIAEISRVVRELQPAQKRILAFLLTKSDAQLRKMKFKVGQRVYFSLGGNYLSHFFKGYVMGMAEDRVIIAARLKKAAKNTTIQLLPDSILNAKEFKKKKRRLIKADRAIMPKEDKMYLSRLPIGEIIRDDGTVPWQEDETVFDYEPPTLDSAPAEWFDKTKKSKKKKGKKSKRLIPITNIEDIPDKKRRKKKSGPLNFTVDTAEL